MTNWLLLLAQATSNPTSQPRQLSGWQALFTSPLVPIMLAFVVFYWWMARSKGKERRNFENMLNSLKRNDRVQTIGGVLGTVVEVRDNEVVLKVDESSNVKMRFNRAAIKEVLRETAESN